MTSLAPSRIPVHSNPPISDLDRKRASYFGLKLPVVPTILPFAAGPLEILADFDPTPAEDEYSPAPLDAAYWSGFSAARSGETGLIWSTSSHRDEAQAFIDGRNDGTKARETAEAWEVGHTLGVISEICCPPGGYKLHEAEAYREGFDAGRRAMERAVAQQVAWFQEETLFEAWVAEQEASRYEISDRDMYPLGGTT